MEKVLTIDGRQVPFKSTGAFLLRYKAQFGRDALKDLARLEKAVKEKEDADESTPEDERYEVGVVDELDLEVFYNMAWTLAKTADPTIPLPFEWLDSFGEFPIMDEIMPEIMELFEKCIRSSKKK